MSTDGSVVGPYLSIHVMQAFLSGKLDLADQVRLTGHVSFFRLSMLFHLLWAPPGGLLSLGPTTTRQRPASPSAALVLMDELRDEKQAAVAAPVQGSEEQSEQVTAEPSSTGSGKVKGSEKKAAGGRVVLEQECKDGSAVVKTAEAAPAAGIEIAGDCGA
eukprot:CAMPEP_0119101412 /NCGR_PEP_ID=MMETSP1180-20130426/469_1 /TAXON_ID=3052 ORGANISM="Chlamydomonas cf sp, Strain CCMP681" /NCGR_SAMPLE_ID=MMETSP1180 /ASSEMBLY_ACC=CAM_ASM_000741 /LENGTH=159 /DNA_ID=CAMNT_0007085529 /DNA_START=179 /DNA_END=658 /DNA_ORIENTATION=+